MKCLLFIITIFLGTFIDVQGEHIPDYGDSHDSVSLEITKDNPPEEPDSKGDESPSETETGNRSEESEQNTYDDKYNSNGDDSTEAKSSEQERREKKKEKKLPGDGLQLTKNSNDEKKYKQHEETMLRWTNELKAGKKSDLMGENEHVVQSSLYHDLGRRSEAQALKNIAAEKDDYLTPEKAPPELVLLVAKESAMLRAGKDTEPGSDYDRTNILRSGNYWNGVWKEEVKPKSAMRTAPQEKKLGSIKAKINPGTEFYKVVSRLKKISPQLLYIINKKQP